MADDTDIAGAINLLVIAFPNYNPDLTKTATLWTVTLGDLPGPLLRAAVLDCVTERGRAFAPSIGEIRDHAVRIEAEREGLPSTWEAYEQICKRPNDSLSRNVAPDLTGEFGWVVTETPVPWSHPFVKWVADILGWPKQFPTDNPSADRAQFARIYEAELSRWLNREIRHPGVTTYIEQRASSIEIYDRGLDRLTKRLEGK